MIQAVICDIQGVLIKNNEVNHNLLEFLIENKNIYTTLILYTNLSKQSVQDLRDNLPEFFQYVDKIYTYADVKQPKPGRGGFEEILNEWKLQPKKVLFIDDNIMNISAARWLGLKTLHYEHFNDISTLKPLLYP